MDLALLHLEGRLHLADKVSPLKELHPALAAVFDVSKGIDVSIFVHTLKEIRRTALLTPKCTKGSSFLIHVCSFHRCCLVCVCWLRRTLKEYQMLYDSDFDCVEV